jgi:hypothetical protein
MPSARMAEAAIDVLARRVSQLGRSQTGQLPPFAVDAYISIWLRSLQHAWVPVAVNAWWHNESGEAAGSLQRRRDLRTAHCRIVLGTAGEGPRPL